MYTTNSTENALDDIRKILLLYEHGIIQSRDVKGMTNKILDIYLTNTVSIKTDER